MKEPEISRPKRSNRFSATTVLLAVVVLLAAASSSWGDLTVIFRYDDFSPDAPGERERNQLRRELWEAERQMDALFKHYGFPYTIAVIPFRATVNAAGQPMVVSIRDDLEKAQLLHDGMQQGRIDVAQHGYAHTQHGDGERMKTEFLGRPYVEQFRDISLGRTALTAALGGEQVRVFVPPWNTWDSHTGRAVRELGFTILSGDKSQHGSPPDGLTIVPCTASLVDLEQRLLRAEHVPEGTALVVLFHPYDIVHDGVHSGEPFGLTRLAALLESVKESKEATVSTITRLVGSDSTLTAGRYRSALQLQGIRSFWRRMPIRWQPGQGTNDVYLPERAYRGLVRRSYLLTGGLLAATVLVGELVRRLATWQAGARRRALVSGVGTVLFLLCLASWYELMSRGWPLNALRVLPAALFLPCPVWLGWQLRVGCAGDGGTSAALRRHCRTTKERDEARASSSDPGPGGCRGDRRRSPGTNGLT